MRMLLVQCEETERLQKELNELTREHDVMSESYERLKGKLNVKDERLNQKDAQIASLKSTIEEMKLDRMIELTEAGNIAEAALRLNGIFEMKNEDMPMFITQPYMYVANNYDNFNCLVRELPAHTLGLRQLFPVFALTGLKFLKPELVSFPIYITKTELTTVTLIYDAYYDFGLAGVLLFGLILGMACKKVTALQERGRNPVALLFYAQIAMYLVFSFFTTWFSNPTTWFWLALTGILYFYVGWIPGGRKSGPVN